MRHITPFLVFFLMASCTNITNTKNSMSLTESIDFKEFYVTTKNDIPYKVSLPAKWPVDTLKDFVFVAHSDKNELDGLLMDSYPFKAYGYSLKEFVNDSYKTLLASKVDSVTFLKYNVTRILFDSDTTYLTWLLTEQADELISAFSFYIEHDTEVLFLTSRFTLDGDVKGEDELFWEILYSITHKGVPLIKSEDLQIIDSKFMPI